MSEDELKDLDKEVKRLKRIASEWASKLHDLVEDRLPAGWQELPEISQATLAACQAWAALPTLACKQPRKPSMATITGRTRGGEEWIPQFVSSLDPRKCIGCGRCYKVCPRQVLDLVERGPELLADSDDDGDDEEMMVMTIANAADCIGCGSCGRVCPKNCYTYTTAET